MHILANRANKELKEVTSMFVPSEFPLVLKPVEETKYFSVIIMCVMSEVCNGKRSGERESIIANPIFGDDVLFSCCLTIRSVVSLNTYYHQCQPHDDDSDDKNHNHRQQHTCVRLKRRQSLS